MIHLQQLSKKYGDLSVLQGIDLHIEAGQWVTIMGPSGSGKTTLLNLIAGLDGASSGEILVAGQRIAKFSEKEQCQFRRETVGLIFQKHLLIPYLTALENVMLAQYFHSLHDEAEAVVALVRVGLEHRLHHLPAQLSGGEQQRVCIARALINAPRLVLADEPTGNLDRSHAVRILDLIKELHEKEKFTMVMVTHDPFVAQWTGRMVLLEDGRLVHDRTLPLGNLRAETIEHS